MRRRILVLVGTALVVGASAVSVGISAGSATAGAQETLQCNKVTGTTTGEVTVKSCRPGNRTDKSASGPAHVLVNGGTLTWKPSGQTTIVGGISHMVRTPDTCKTGWTEYNTTGLVISGTSTYTKVGDHLNALTCVSKTGKITILKGSTLSL